MTPGLDETHDITVDDELMQDSHAQYGFYRPEIRNLNDPLTYKEAVRKYRQHADPHMSDQMRTMRKIGMQTNYLSKASN